jgi:16S rRNA (guanine(527)-N(7))-methyltransferase RsmG
MSVKAAEGLNMLLEEFGIPTGSENALKFRIFLALLQKWNQRMNLTASTDWDFLKYFFWEGIWAAGFYPEWFRRHLDIGSGAGFPGIPLAILEAHTIVEMVESREKRALFLENAVRELDLAHSVVHQQRVLDLLKASGGHWDCFSWKAIKLNVLELETLCERGSSEGHAWMFHGKEMAVQDFGEMAKRFELVKSERFPGRNDWNLAIFKKLPVQSELNKRE